MYVAQNCGALTSASFSTITFKDNAEVILILLILHYVQAYFMNLLLVLSALLIEVMLHF